MKTTIATVCLAFAMILMIFPICISAKSFQVGVSPLILNLGELERGTTKVASFSIITSSDESFMVDVKAARGDMGFFDERTEMLKEYSEVDASGWVEFMNNPIYLDTELEGEDPGIKRFEEIRFLVKVPEDAEPGYHLVELVPTPRVPSGRITGVNVVAITKINMFFRVSGEAVRSGELLDINAEIAGPRTKFDLFFQNTGTVTMSAKANEIEIYDQENNIIGKMMSNTGSVEPGGMLVLNGYYNSPLQPGDYRVFANISYFSDHVEGESDVWIEVPVVVPAGKIVEAVVFPWWVVVLAAVLMFSYIIYRKA